MNRRKIKYTAYRAVGALMTALYPAFSAPIFVLGTGRCGSTLLVRILDSHEDLVGFPAEGNELWHPKSYPFVDRSLETPSIIEDPALFTEISKQNWPPGQHQRIQRTLNGFHRLHGSGKTLFVKSAMISFMMADLIRLFPGCRFIHIYRNGPSVVESFIKKDWGKYHDYFESEQDYLVACSRYWRDCMTAIDRQRQELSLTTDKEFMEISYEELCRGPTDALQRLASFLAVDIGKFQFDLESIASANYKVGDYETDDRWAEPLNLMAPVMALKGYSQ